MLGIVANKQNKQDKGVKYIYIGQWKSQDKVNTGYFRFAIEQDQNLVKNALNNLAGYEGSFRIRTKSNLDFAPEDVVIFRGQKYAIEQTQRDMKLDGESSHSRFVANGNITTFINLRRLGK